MGLDISAYRRAVFLEILDGPDEYYERYWRPEHEGQSEIKTAHAYHWLPEFADRTPPIVKNGVYRVDRKQLHFRAGSYSGYNWWREQLSRIALDVAPRFVWMNRARFQGMPFYELIDFSDAEGIIGSVVARKLAGDFTTYQERIDAVEWRDPTDGAWFLEKYRLWQQAFELAVDDGFVEFH